VSPTNPPPTAATNAPAREAAASATSAFRGLQLRTGFRLQLVASDPLVNNPVALAFDAAGRLFVAEQGSNPAEGRVQLLEDTDGDGVFEKASAFADKLQTPTALICYGGGVFVASGSSILFLADTTGKGVADLRREVYGGIDASTVSPGPGGGVNHFTWGLDNRIHAASGGASGNLSCVAIPSAQTLPLTGNDFAFDPRTLAVGLEAGDTHRGVSFDNAGRRFTGSATHPVQLAVTDPVHAARNPLLVWPQLLTDLTPEDARYTRASSLLVYRGGALPTNYVHDVFIADPMQRAVTRWHLRENGAVPVLDRPSSEIGSDFLASSGPAFRPVQVVSGPDGTLYVADLGRVTLDQPATHGRIWRISPTNLKPAKPPQLAAFKTPDLVGVLASPNGWVRDTAARLLFERRDTNTIPLLTKQLARSKDARARLGSLRALEGLEALTAAQAASALNDGDEAIRVQAAQVAEDYVQNGDVPNVLWDALLGAAGDSSVRVRFQTALTLGRVRRPAVPLLLANIARNAPEDRALHLAVLTASAGRANEVFIALLNDPRLGRQPAGWELLRQLATLTGEEALGNMDNTLVALNNSPHSTLESLTLARLLGEGLYSAGSSFVATAPRESWRGLGYEALDIGVGGGSDEVRSEAIRFVGVSGYSSQEVGDWLLALLVPGESQAVQSAAITALARFGDPVITTAFIRRWSRLSAISQREIIARLLERFDRTMALVSALEQGQIPRNALSATQINFLRSYRDPATARRAIALYGPPGQEGVAARYAEVLELKGSAPRGHELFTARCAACHRYRGEGQAFGQDLDTAYLRSRAKLLQDILEPDTEISPGYQTRVVQRTDNVLLFGLVSQPNPNVVLVRAPGAPPVFLPAAQVQETLPQNWSLMPPNTVAGLTEGDLADLLEYVSSQP
jgi:putative heme-binding domain-containing protein